MFTSLACRLILTLVPLLGDDDWRVRERAEESAAPLVSSLRAWEYTRGLAAREEDEEVRARLTRCWKGATSRIVTELLPADHPMWPDADRLPLKCNLPFADDDNLILRTTPYQFFGMDGPGGYNARMRKVGERPGFETPPFWWGACPHWRDACRTWAALELSTTGDPAHVRAMLWVACKSEKKRLTWAGEDFVPAVRAYDPTLLNPRYVK